VAPSPPTLDLLDALIAAYTRSVPWESAFRIAKSTRTPDAENCPRWPDEFWDDALARGGGGTCFESNYAFFSLLRALGYEGYLTINNMDQVVGCHAAIMLRVNGRRWLVDAGLPLYVPLPIDPSTTTQRPSPFHTYTVRPDGKGRYQIERTQHLKRNCYTLIDTPVPNAAYRAATTADYGVEGFFLHRVIVYKVVRGQVWRFNSAETPLHLESFQDGKRTDHPLDGDVAQVVAGHFGMDVTTVRAALAATRFYSTSISDIGNTQ
jgi:arylamine N-acetyltransferase